MCPVCIATAAWIAAGAGSTGGISALVVSRLRGSTKQQPTTRTTRKERDMDKNNETQTKMNTPPIVSPQEWETARQQLLVKEKELTHARDALAAERRRMPWLAVQKKDEFDGARGKGGPAGLVAGR